MLAGGPEESRIQQLTRCLLQVLGLGMLFAASVAGPAFAETLAKPEVTGGEKVKAPKSAPTKPAAAPKPTPTADVKEGGDLVRLL